MVRGSGRAVDPSYGAGGVRGARPQPVKSGALVIWSRPWGVMRAGTGVQLAVMRNGSSWCRYSNLYCEAADRVVFSSRRRTGEPPTLFLNTWIRRVRRFASRCQILFRLGL